ncbi:MAG TPA: CysB family HTH-type transcriptional regulator [Telluria sp.]|nr:CysB family HTH-type transcriptional regulator [Telluria sp.]
MNFQQLRSVREAARRNFNLTDVAAALFTSQPGVSRQIRELEDELGVVIFERNGKRLTGLTEPGKGILRIIERLLIEAENLQTASVEFAAQDSGTLTVAVTHTQARYAVPRVVQSFRARFPNVHIHLQQSAPEQIAQSVLAGKADIGIATEGISAFPDLVSFPCYRWSHLIVVPDEHPLLALPTISLADLARHPLITYDVGFTGRGHLDQAFAEAGLQPDIVLTAMDSDVIKQYVALGLGVGIVASMAFDHGRDKGLRAVEASHLFAQNTTRLAVRRGAYLRRYAYDFIEEFAPALKRAEIERALAFETNGPE